MKTFILLSLAFISLSSQAGVRVLCKPETMEAAVDKVFEQVDSPLSASGSNKAPRMQLGRRTVGSAVKEDFKLPTTEEYLDVLVKEGKVKSKNSSDVSCSQVALMWVDQNKAEIVKKYNVKYNEELLQSMIKNKSFNGENSNCVVLDIQSSKVEKMCDGKRSPNSLIKTCTMRFVCTDNNSQQNASPTEDVQAAICTLVDPEKSCESLSLSACLADESIQFDESKEFSTVEKVRNSAVGQ